jgi:hypothetical protein
VALPAMASDTGIDVFSNPASRFSFDLEIERKTKSNAQNNTKEQEK